MKVYPDWLKSTTRTTPKLPSQIRLPVSLLHSYQPWSWWMQTKIREVSWQVWKSRNQEKAKVKIVITESTDYSILFYILDGSILAVCVLSLWLNVTMRKSALTTTESLKNIWNKASLIFFSLLFTWGLLYGVKDTYLVPYLSDDLGASSQLISQQDHINWSPSYTQ